MSDKTSTLSGTSEMLLAEVTDEFLDRLNRGEQPEIEEYAERHPAIAAVIRQVFPALQILRLPAADADGAADASKEKDDLAGRLGDYRIIREIGRGGMGIVYEAEQVSLGRRVALKVLPFAAVLDQRQLQRFKNEAQAATAAALKTMLRFRFRCLQDNMAYASFLDKQMVRTADPTCIVLLGDANSVSALNGSAIES